MNHKISRLLTVCLLLAVLTVGFAPVQGAPATAAQTTHVVRWGETLQSIAARYGCTVNAIVQANGLANPNYIYVGQTLIIPVAGSPAPVPSGGTTYVVKWGDSLSSIAWRYGVTVQAIMSANGLANPNFIYAGQTLRIPGGSPPAPPTPPPGPPPAKTYYTVKWGDTLTSIAFKYGTTVNAIMQANNLANAWYIYVGQLLVIPSGVAVPSYPAGTYYTVRPGDTLYRIAMRYGTSVWALVQANNLPNASLIRVGQVLVIPGAYTPPATPPPYPPYPTPPAYPPYPTPWPPGPLPPIVTQQYVGRITDSNCTDQDTWEFRSVLRVIVTGKVGLPVKVSSNGWETTGLTGTKPEYGPYAVEFAPFNQGVYTVTPEGLGTSLQVRLDGKCTAYVQFDPVNLTSVSPH